MHSRFRLLRATHVTEVRSVYLSVCIYPSATLVHPVKTVGRNEMPFGMGTCVVPRNIVFCRGPPAVLLREGEIWGTEPPVRSDADYCQITLVLVISVIIVITNGSIGVVVTQNNYSGACPGGGSGPTPAPAHGRFYTYVLNNIDMVNLSPLFTARNMYCLKLCIHRFLEM